MRASPEEFEERLGEGDDKRVPGAPHRWSPVPEPVNDNGTLYGIN